MINEILTSMLVIVSVLICISMFLTTRRPSGLITAFIVIFLLIVFLPTIIRLISPAIRIVLIIVSLVAIIVVALRLINILRR